jgi:hypothetical protein
MNFRLKNFFVSVLFPILMVLFLRNAKFEGFILYGTVFVGVVVQYFLCFWLLNFELFPQGFVTILILPALWFGSFLLIFETFILKLNLVYQIVVTAVFLGFQYYFMITQSILNIAHFKNVTLSQAAYTTNNLYTILTFFLANLSLFLLNDLNVFIKFVISGILFAVILLIYMLLNNINKSQFFFSVASYTFTLLILSFIYSTDVIDSSRILFLVMILGLVFKGFMTLVQYSSRKVLSIVDYSQVFIEYILIFFILFKSLL